MLLSSNSIEKMVNIIIGTAGVSNPLIKKDVDNLFYSCGEKDRIKYYDVFFENYPEIKNNTLYCTRSYKLEKYVFLQLQEMNGTAKLCDFIMCYFSNISQYTTTPEEAVEYLNRFFNRDGYSLEKIEESSEYKIYSLDDCLVNYDCLFKESERGNYILINEHNKKCIDKIKNGDYTGAITNSRSLLEQILRELQLEFSRLDDSRPYNGQNIVPLLKSVLERLNVKEGLTGQPLSGYTKLEEGFVKLTDGLSVIRHGMSDAHNISHIPSKKDALLIVNTAKTLANFIVQVYFEKFVNAA